MLLNIFIWIFITRLQKRIGCEPSEEQLAISLKMSCAELRSINLECSLAREKLTMSNVRLVMSVAHRYNNMGAEMADLVQVSPTFSHCDLLD